MKMKFFLIFMCFYSLSGYGRVTAKKNADGSYFVTIKDFSMSSLHTVNFGDATGDVENGTTQNPNYYTFLAIKTQRTLKKAEMSASNYFETILMFSSKYLSDFSSTLLNLNPGYHNFLTMNCVGTSNGESPIYVFSDEANILPASGITWYPVGGGVRCKLLNVISSKASF